MGQEQAVPTLTYLNEAILLLLHSPSVHIHKYSKCAVMGSFSICGPSAVINLQRAAQCIYIIAQIRDTSK